MLKFARVVAHRAEILRPHAALGALDLVTWYDRIGAIAKGFNVSPSEMGNVKEPFDLTACRSIDVDRRRHDRLETSIIPSLKFRQPFVGAIQHHPKSGRSAPLPGT